MKKSAIVSSISALTLALSGCGGGESTAPLATGNATTTEGSASPTAARPSPTTPEVATSDTPPEAGTRGNPYPAGSAVTLGDYEVTLGSTVQDATEQVAAENEFNEPPAEGRQFVMVPVTATYTGDESGTAWADLSIQFVGSAGNTFGAGQDDYCGVIPNDLFNAGEMFAGATADGNVCVSVPSDQVEGGVWMVEEMLSLDGTSAFIALD